MSYLDNFIISFDPGITEDKSCLVIGEKQEDEFVIHTQLFGNDAKVVWDIISHQGRRLETIEKHSRSSKGRCFICGADKHDYASTGNRHFQGCILRSIDD